MGDTYSSAHLRERDKFLLEKHQKELALVERKVDRLKWSNNDLLKQLFEANNRGLRLANSLGFKDVAEAQVCIDTADNELSFVACLNDAARLEREVSEERKKREVLELEVSWNKDETKRLSEEAAEERAQKERLETELRKAKAESDVLRKELDEVRRENERTALSDRVKPSSDLKSVSLALSQLQERYDSLVVIKERAADRYKKDYKKWRSIKRWLFDDAQQDKQYSKGEENRKRRANARVLQKRKIMMEIGPDLTLFDGENENEAPNTTMKPPNLDGLDPANKENQATLIVDQRRQSDTVSLFPTSIEATSPLVVSTLSPTIAPPVYTNHEDRPKSILLSSENINTRIPLQKLNRPSIPSTSSPKLPGHQRSSQILIPSSEIVDELEVPRRTLEQDLPLSPVAFRKEFSGASSETEDDSQPPIAMPVLPLTRPAPFPDLPPLSSPPPPSAPLTPAPFPKLSPLLHPALPPRPSFPQVTSPSNLKRRSDVGLSSNGWGSQKSKKIRRLSGDPFMPAFASGSAVKPIYIQDEDLPAGSGSARQDDNVEEDRTLNKKGKGKQKEFPTPFVQPYAGHNGLGDYSAYKGRGRYAQATPSNNKTINAMFTIDASRNGGMDFQYDEVVRGREDRRRMDAGDCECCRDYYEAIGPLPNRLQQPLWRSPPATPAKKCTRHHQHGTSTDDTDVAQVRKYTGDDSARQTAIATHKQAISRHRHHWARANTPPGYWNIGFPDTQEAKDINEKAKEMHRKKKEEIAEEARRGNGKYKKR